MNAYRYNCKDRSSRAYNNCGKEKNPNAVKFYASNLDYAAKYSEIYDRDGYLVEKCTLEVTELPVLNLFDMAANYASLTTYKNYIDSSIESMRSDYTYDRDTATTAKRRKLFQGFIDGLVNEEEKLLANLVRFEFQSLSDFERQNELVAELQAMGFDGYYTKNEIAVF